VNILITGYNGFVGSNLARKLGDHRLLGVDIVKSDLVSRHFGWGDFSQATEVDGIIHLAGLAHDRRNTAEGRDYFRINVGLTKKIFEYFLASAAKKFIFFSSIKAVTESVRSGPLTEDEPPNPLTSYGRSKLEAERCITAELAQWEARGMIGGKEGRRKAVYILRPCMIHGPGNKGNLNRLYKLVSKGVPWPLGIYENKRSYTSMDNLSYVIRQLLEKDIKPGIYQIADDEPISTNELIRLIATQLGKKQKILKIDEKLVRFAANVGDRLNLAVINKEVLNKIAGSYEVSNSKIKRALGIIEMPIRAEEGIKETLRSLMSQP
jgi:nucleoside-diphosphate-sugar epimerase